MSVFFFSSRRRHTRCSRDWSSDVCSSDLDVAAPSADGYAAFDESERGPPRDSRVADGFGHVLASRCFPDERRPQDRKSTRLNSSHGYISYAVFCLKKKTKAHQHDAL